MAQEESASRSRASARQPLQQPSAASMDAAGWQLLYRMAGTAALISALAIPMQIVVFVVWPPPLQGPVSDWFEMFRQNRLIGLLSLDLLLLLDQVLLIPIFLALYIALRRCGPSLMLVSTTMALLGTAIYFASSVAFEMLALSGQYAAATTDAARSLPLAAGTTLLAVYQGTAFKVSYVLQAVAGLIIAGVMLRGRVFSRFTATMGLLGNLVACGLFLPKIGMGLALLSVVFLEVWYILLARRFFQLR